MSEQDDKRLNTNNTEQNNTSVPPTEGVEANSVPIPDTPATTPDAPAATSDAPAVEDEQVEDAPAAEEASSEENPAIKEAIALWDKMPDEDEPKKVRRRHGPVYRTLHVLMRIVLTIILIVLLLPILVYIPPIQDLLVHKAAEIASEKTGMTVEIERFRLKFPLDVSLQGVKVIEAKGDTMVTAGEALADVKVMPLLQLDVQIKKLNLRDGYYRMLSEDSSMMLKLRARELIVNPGSSCNLKTNVIDLQQADIKGANIAMYMNVWKQKYTPPDTTSKPFTIKIGRANLEDVTFGMSMLPTIDTLTLKVDNGVLEDGLIDLNTNDITAKLLALDKGDITYLTPTEKYIKSHPLPPDTMPKDNKPPMTIKADSVSLTNFGALYATKGAKPQRGFDPSYIKVTGLNAQVVDFYNQQATLSVPILSLTARERCGLNITRCSGTLAIDETGITLDEFKVRTPASSIDVDASLSYSLMAMEKRAPVKVDAKGHIGQSDIRAFMPSLGSMLKLLPNKPLKFIINARGTLSSILLKILNIELPGTMSLFAQGKIVNALEPKKLAGDLKFNGWLGQPSMLSRFMPDIGVHIPTFRIVGDATFDMDKYRTNLQLLTPQGDATLAGVLTLSRESYDADFAVKDLNMGYIMPELGLGHVSAHIQAEGVGFDFTSPRTWIDCNLDVTRLEYMKRSFGEVAAGIHMENGEYEIDLSSYDPLADLDLSAKGHINRGTYYLDAQANINNLDLYALGLTEDPNGGSGVISINGSANPDAWDYDVKLDVSNFEWTLPGEQYIHLAEALSADFVTNSEGTSLCLRSFDVDCDFDSPEHLPKLMKRVTAITDSTMRMIEERRLDVEMLQRNLPQFDFAINAAGHGGITRFLDEFNVELDTISLQLSNADKITGSGLVYNLKTEALNLDTIALTLNQRNRLLDYRVHVGNRPGTLDDFAQVDLGGYVGGNRASISVKQRDIEGEMSYHVGVTMAVEDKEVEVHFTPLDAIIAGMPWTFNDDNYVQYNLANNDIHALLYATSNDSRIDMKSEPNEDGDNTVCIKLDNIKIEDFLNLAVMAPPVTGTVNADIDLVYKGNAITGEGYINTTALTYDKMSLGDLGFDFDADLDFEGNTDATIGLRMNGNKVLTGHAILDNDPESKKPMEFDLSTDRLPLDILNPFIGKDVATLNGYLNGRFAMTGSFVKPILNGQLSCIDATAKVPMIGTTLRIDTVPILVKDNVLDFNNFSVWAINDHPLVLSGTVDAQNLTNPKIDIALAAENMQLVGNDKRARSDIYGKLFYNLNATAKGTLKYMAINANLNILPATDVYYNLNFSSQAMAQQNAAEGVVKFVNLQDTTQVAETDTVGPMMNMKIGATLTISQGAKATVNLSGNGTDRVVVNPSGTLTYTQNVMGDMRLNGRLNTGAGLASYTIPAIGNKQFELDPESYVLWNGDIMNPTLSINAVDKVKANVSSGGQAARSVNFDVGLSISGTLNAPKLQFDLSTTDDMTIQNELQSMSADQRSNQAMNLLLYGAYTGAGSKTQFNLSGENMLYSFLESQLNSWVANHVRGVDLSFGIDQYDTNNNGQAGTAMSYSYQVSKSLFNNRFKIVVGGNYSTDASADENFAQNLISDISFEYTVLQRNNLSILAKLFRHTGFESVLEGEITETGVGVVMRRKLSNLKQLFRFRRRNRNKQRNTNEDTDTIPGIHTVRFPTAPTAAPAKSEPEPQPVVNPEPVEEGPKYNLNTGEGY